MSYGVEHSTHYYTGEGRPFMEDCVRRAVEWCAQERLSTLVIFTGTGEGPHYAAKEYLSQDQYRSLRIVAVSPPVGRPYRKVPGDEDSPLIRAGINRAIHDDLSALGVPVISAHLPFKEMWNGKERTSDWTRVAEAYGVLGGGFALCIQAVLVACDAGVVEHGERVVVMTADTAFVTSACRTEAFLSPTEGILVEHVICRPRRYDISKRTHQRLNEMWGFDAVVVEPTATPPPGPPPPSPPLLLPSPTTSQPAATDPNLGKPARDGKRPPKRKRAAR